MALQQLDQEFQGEQDRSHDHRPFDEDVITPVLWKRRIGFGHRAISQVVPSLESLITTPIAASSSRMRSDSLKSFRARAAVRLAISAFTASLLTGITFGSLARYCFLVFPRRPSSIADTLS